MPPKGKSKALAEKHSYLGRFTKNAKSLEEMRLKISNQEKEIKDSEDALVEQKTELASKQKQIKTCARKFLHKASKQKQKDTSLKELSKSQAPSQRFSFAISRSVKSHRLKKPTNTSLSRMTRTIRRSQTYQACSLNHGASSINQTPVIEGMIDALTSKVKSAHLSKAILNAKPSLVKEIEKNVLLKWKFK